LKKGCSGELATPECNNQTEMCYCTGDLCNDQGEDELSTTGATAAPVKLAVFVICGAVLMMSG